MRLIQKSVIVALTLGWTPMSAYAQRREPVLEPKFTLTSCINAGASRSCEIPPAAVLVMDTARTQHRPLRAALIGAGIGGTVFLLGNTIAKGPCKSGGDSWVPCPVAYAYVFSIGALFGGVIGFIVSLTPRSVVSEDK